MRTPGPAPRWWRSGLRLGMWSPPCLSSMRRYGLHALALAAAMISRAARAPTRQHSAPCPLQFVKEDGTPLSEELSIRSYRLRPGWPASSSPKDLDVYEVCRAAAAARWPCYAVRHRLVTSGRLPHVGCHMQTYWAPPLVPYLPWTAERETTSLWLFL